MKKQFKNPNATGSTEHIGIKVTKEFKKTTVEACEKTNLSYSEFLRRLILKGCKA